MSKEKLKKLQRGPASSFDNSFNMRLLIPFGPEALPVARSLRTLLTSIEVRMVALSSELQLYEARFGNVALLLSRYVG